jgi:hypothetical protein
MPALVANAARLGTHRGLHAVALAAKSGRPCSHYAIALASLIVACSSEGIPREGSEGNGPSEHKGSPTAGSAEAAPDAPPAPETLYARSIEWGLGYYPKLLMSEAETKGRWHLRILKERGRVTRFERVDPAGLVQKTSVVTYGENGGNTRRVTDGRGVEIEVVTMTKDGRESRVARSGNPLNSGCAQLAFTFDANDDALTRLCLDEAGRAMRDERGCTEIRYEYKSPHELASSRCMRDRGEPALDADGVHARKHTYDRDQLIRVIFLGVDDKPVRDRYRCWGTATEFDSAGNETFTLCLGEDGTTQAGYAQTFDEHGCILTQRSIDAARATATNAAWASKKFERDPYCGELAREFLDHEGALVSVPPAKARRESTRDERGQVIEHRCFDAKREPTNCDAGGAGKGVGSVLRYTVDDRGRTTRTRGFDANGKPSRLWRDYPHESAHTWDVNGRLIETAYYDTDGKPATALISVARQAFQHDAWGARIRLKNFGVDGKPVVDKYGVHEARWIFDEKHLLSSIELRDTSGELRHKTAVVLDGVSWPENAARVEVIRENGVKNRFVDRAGKQLSLVHCSRRTLCHE